MFTLVVFTLSVVVVTASLMFAMVNSEPYYLVFTISGLALVIGTLVRLIEGVRLVRMSQGELPLVRLSPSLADAPTPPLRGGVGAPSPSADPAEGEGTQRRRQDSLQKLSSIRRSHGDLARPTANVDPSHTMALELPVVSRQKELRQSYNAPYTPAVSRLADIGVLPAIKVPPNLRVPSSGLSPVRLSDCPITCSSRQRRYSSNLDLSVVPSTDFVFAAMCHEVRTPLNGVMGMIELLLDTALSRKQRHIAQTVYNSSQVLSQAVNDYVLFFRAQSGEDLEKPANAECNIQECLLQVGILFQGLAYDKGLDLVIDIDDNVPTMLECDPRRLQQLVGNLVLNAITYTKVGEVCIGVRADLTKMPVWGTKKSGDLDGKTCGTFPLEIYVSDSGPGLAEDEMQDLFVPFRRLQTSYATRGSGLGLAICKIIAQSMNASISVDSELGVGTTFVISVEMPVVERRDLLPEWRYLNSARIYGGEVGSKFALMAYLEQLGMEAIEGTEDDLVQFDPKEEALKEAACVFVFADELGQKASKAFARAKASVCHVRWLSDPSAFEASDGFTLVRPFTRETVGQILVSMDNRTQRQSTVDRWRSTFAAEVPLKVLIAEDDRVSLQVLVGMLERLGYSPCTVTRGDDALEAVRRERPDVAILDMYMPGMNGLEVVRQCSDLDVWWVISSAGTPELNEKNVADFGIQDLMLKPLSIEAVRNTLLKAARSIGIGSEKEGGAPEKELFAAARVSGTQVSERAKHKTFEEIKGLFADAPDDLMRILEKQLDQIDGIVESVDACIGSSDIDEMRQHAHRLRSSAAFTGSYGVAAVSDELDRRWEILTHEKRIELILELKKVWLTEDRDRLIHAMERLQSAA